MVYNFVVKKRKKIITEKVFLSIQDPEIQSALDFESEDTELHVFILKGDQTYELTQKRNYLGTFVNLIPFPHQYRTSAGITPISFDCAFLNPNSVNKNIHDFLRRAFSNHTKMATLPQPSFFSRFVHSAFDFHNWTDAPTPLNPDRKICRICGISECELTSPTPRHIFG